MGFPGQPWNDMLSGSRPHFFLLMMVYMSNSISCSTESFAFIHSKPISSTSCLHIILIHGNVFGRRVHICVYVWVCWNVAEFWSDKVGSAQTNVIQKKHQTFIWNDNIQGGHIILQGSVIKSWQHDCY